MNEKDTQVINLLDSAHQLLSTMSQGDSALPLRDTQHMLVRVLQRCAQVAGDKLPAHLRHDWPGEFNSGKPVSR